jgi:prolyl-tRNA synthetase
MKYIKNEIKNRDTFEFLWKDIYSFFFRKSSIETTASEAIIMHKINWIAKYISSI